jgi:D-alanyl-D-alanine carboxypeptidase/D-alanyl-D-alanine-endopeptidase (penicillin-binding protein 4)
MKKRLSLLYTHLLVSTFSFLIFTSCSVEKQIAKSAKSTVLSAAPFQAAHVGISIYDPAVGKYLYNYQGDKYFVPASNTKIPTCYAAMKYLGDSLVGLRYSVSENNVWIQAAADPTFLHPEFKKQPVFEFLSGQKGNLFYSTPNSGETGWGSGWSWNDYDQGYMAERSSMPIYGNVVRFKKGRTTTTIVDSLPPFEIEITPSYFRDKNFVSRSSWKDAKGISIDRGIAENFFIITPGSASTSTEVPFTGMQVILPVLLKDTLNRDILPGGTIAKKLEKIIYSQPTDSLLRPMMHRSDNFYAEQSLLMVSNEKLGVINDARIIDTLLKTDLKDLPQKPRWVDGSGLSRYNLFTPQDFVTILNKMQKEFPMARIKEIFPTGGEGTISSYYKADSGYIYAKTGTLSGVVAFSGFMYTKKGKLLIFSTLVNNHQASATDIRLAIEKFLQGVRNKY